MNFLTSCCLLSHRSHTTFYHYFSFYLCVSSSQVCKLLTARTGAKRTCPSFLAALGWVSGVEPAPRRPSEDLVEMKDKAALSPSSLPDPLPNHGHILNHGHPPPPRPTQPDSSGSVERWITEGGPRPPPKRHKASSHPARAAVPTPQGQREDHRANKQECTPSPEPPRQGPEHKY